MAVRVTCEDANDGFKPMCGGIDELNFRTSPDVWGYFSVKSGGGIHEFSDSQVPFPALTHHRQFTGRGIQPFVASQCDCEAETSCSR